LVELRSVVDDALVLREPLIVAVAQRVVQHDCEFKKRCCPNTSHRKIARSIYEDSRDVARTVCTTPAYELSRRERKKVEMLFAHLKRILKLDRLRLRGITGARDEFLMAPTAQNLRRMARWLTQRAASTCMS
jgi:hypothetical protein